MYQARVKSCSGGQVHYVGGSGVWLRIKHIYARVCDHQELKGLGSTALHLTHKWALMLQLHVCFCSLPPPTRSAWLLAIQISSWKHSVWGRIMQAVCLCLQKMAYG
jgi:hypothetical protein